MKSGNCSGCGACSLIDDELSLVLNDEGYLRPVRRKLESETSNKARNAKMVQEFRRTCPGKRVSAVVSSKISRDDTIGPIVAAWSAWAADPEMRFRGSSGGALTALSAWLVDEPSNGMVNGCQAAASDARRTVSVTISTKEDALAAAGSRYAPVGSASHPAALDPSGAFVGKPCEVSAVRSLHDHRKTAAPLLMSFFCAGTPSQNATDGLTDSLIGDDPGPVVDLWYRGRGWPGSFSVVTRTSTYQTTYDESWGMTLGPTVQWRCKLCPDGVGEASDISAADFWTADSRGYPSFSEQDGRTALIARTTRGQKIVLDAVAQGVLCVAPLDVGQLVQMQPLQHDRRATLVGRLVGASLAGRRVPRFSGFQLLKLGARQPRRTWRAGRGTYSRIKGQSGDSRRLGGLHFGRAKVR